MERLFVYGTLAPGRANHGILEAISGAWAAATLRGTLFDEGWGARFGCPGIVPSDDGEEIQGYLFSSEELSDYWTMLDEFEGDAYERVVVSVRTEHGKVVEACVYALRRIS